MWHCRHASELANSGRPTAGTSCLSNCRSESGGNQKKAPARPLSGIIKTSRVDFLAPLVILHSNAVVPNITMKYRASSKFCMFVVSCSIIYSGRKVGRLSCCIRISLSLSKRTLPFSTSNKIGPARSAGSGDALEPQAAIACFFTDSRIEGGPT